MKMRIEFEFDSREWLTWLVPRVGKTRARKELRGLLLRHGEDGLWWRTFAWQNGDLRVIHVDDEEQYRQDGWQTMSANEGEKK